MKSEGINVLVNQIIAWESGDMESDAEIVFFQSLVKSGLCWEMQGMYARRAKQLLDDGLIMESNKRKRPTLITKPVTIDGILLMDTDQPGEA